MFNFIFNGRSSSDMSLKIKESNHNSIPSKRIEFISVPGRQGDLIIDDGTKENLIIEVICKLDVRKTNNFSQVCDSIGIWLQGQSGYKDLIFSDGNIFKAVCINQIDISKIIKNYGEVKINFSAYKEVV